MMVGITAETGAAGAVTGATAAGTGVACWAQFIVTFVVPTAAPDVTRIVAVPPWLCGAVSTASTPPPWSTEVVGEIVPRLVVRVTFAPGVLVTAVINEELPQLRLVGAADTLMFEALTPTPVAVPPAWAQS